jgi:excisionase family DNA binding protein
MFIGTKEAAAMLGCTVKTLHNKTYRHEIPYYAPCGNKNLRFDVDELEKYIRKSRVSTSAEISADADRRLSAMSAGSGANKGKSLPVRAGNNDVRQTERR